MQNKRSYKIIDVCFISILGLIVLVCATAVFVREKDIIEIENRKSTKLPIFTVSDFSSYKYQSNFEKALGDQFIGRDSAKLFLSRLKQQSFNTLFLPFIDKQHYYPITDNLYAYGNGEHLLYRTLSESEIKNSMDIMESVANSYNRVQGVDKYLYFVVHDGSSDFTNPEVNACFVELIKTLYPRFKMDYLKINDFEDFERYFYKADHHWNHIGSYQGYTDIVNMIFQNKEELVPIEDEVTFDIMFYGSKARSSLFYEFGQNLTVYTFNLPEFHTFIDGVEKTYGNKDLYFNYTEDNKPNYSGHYGVYYGEDYAEVIYDFNQPEKQNLLIVANSYSNAINDILASHFNKTYVLDFRHEHDPNFDIDQYIIDNNIDILLFIADSAALTMEASTLRRPK